MLRYVIKMGFRALLDVHMASKESPSLKEYVASNQSTTPDVNFASGSQKKRTKVGVSLP